MALRALKLRHDIEKKREELAALEREDKNFEAREAELEKSIGEAGTEEEENLVSQAIDTFESEKAEHEEQKTKLSDEIAEL